MYKQLQKAIDLVKKTGDRLLIYDMSHSDAAFAVMSVDEYEKMMLGGNEVRGLTEGQLIDKINRDIAIWKNDHDLYGSELELDRKARKYLSDLSQKRSFADKFNPNLDSGKDLGPAEGEFGAWDDFDQRDEEDEFLSDEEEEKIYRDIEASLEKQSESEKRRNPWAIPSERKQAAEEIIDEDTQYLEKID